MEYDIPPGRIDRSPSRNSTTRSKMDVFAPVPGMRGRYRNIRTGAISYVDDKGKTRYYTSRYVRKYQETLPRAWRDKYQEARYAYDKGVRADRGRYVQQYRAVQSRLYNNPISYNQASKYATSRYNKLRQLEIQLLELRRQRTQYLNEDNEFLAMLTQDQIDDLMAPDGPMATTLVELGYRPPDADWAVGQSQNIEPSITILNWLNGLPYR